ncbi:MAG: TonB-dependent receptor, partial [Gemmatimonadetes bacterium]|nr:TonB-dependent receptor [Gemmatimonadota bacterium]
GSSTSTEYRGVPEGETATFLADAYVRTVGAFGELGVPLGAFQVRAGGALTGARGRVYSAPRLVVHWRRSEAVSVFAEASRRQQFTHSLRTRESPAAGLLPTALWVVSDEGLPPSESEQVTFGAVLTPLPGVQIRSTAFVRRLRGFAQASASSTSPFATGSVEPGDASSRGLALDAGFSGSRYGIMASYGWQRVLYQVGDVDYRPSHGATHRALAGIIFYPNPTLSFRLGGTGEWGRTATGFEGAFEWEACTLRDYGCEFGGSPAVRNDLLGGVGLPDYVRVDLGVRKHWHLDTGPVEGTLELYGTLSNLFGHENVLNFGLDPESGELTPITMLPRGPLVIGVEWHF